MSIPRVVILGGGFAGLAAARALQHSLRIRRCDLTLVDSSPVTTMVPALPDYAAGLLEVRRITAPLAPRLPAGSEFIRAEVITVNLQRKQVETTAGPVEYDFLILGMGSVAVSGPAQWPTGTTFSLAGRSDAERLRKAFEAYLKSATAPHVLISGAGYTGVELGVCLSRRARRDGVPLRVTLLERRPRILSFLSDRQRRRVLESLRRHGVVLRTNCRLESFDGERALLSDDSRLEGILVCRTEGTCAPSTPEGVKDRHKMPDGRLKVTPALRLPDDGDVYAAGDAAAIASGDGLLRKAVNFAIFSGHHAGVNIARRLRGKAATPFRPLDLGWVIPLGDDSVGRAFGRVPLFGKPGLRLHYLMCGVRNYNLRNRLFFVGQALRAGRKPQNPNNKKKENL